MLVIEIFFWLSIFTVVYAFLLYPLVIVLLSKVRRIPWDEKVYNGKVSLIIAAHNEEGVIRQKIENCLTLDYASMEWEVIIVSDGSEDSTNQILLSLQNSSPNLKIVTYQPRQGKATALNKGMAQATGDILVFSDANVMLEPNALIHLLKPFTDHEVGAVTGKILVKGTGNDEIAGESVYMKYEGIIHKAEAHFWSMATIDGALFALRKKLSRQLEPYIILDDFALSMEANLARLRIVFAEDAKGIEEMIPSIEDEFKRKTRIIAGGFQYFFMLLKRKEKMRLSVWFAFLSHKLSRWFAGWAMLILLLCNIFLMSKAFYSGLLLLQTFFYAVAFCGYLVPRCRKIHPFYIAYYFCVVNYSAMVGLLRFLTGKQGSLWKKVSR